MSPEPTARPPCAVIVAARDEADRIGATVSALHRALPDAWIVVADSGSRDATATRAERAGADVVRAGRSGGKGSAMTAAARRVLAVTEPSATVVLCDGDLGDSAGRISALAEAVEAGRCDLAVAVFSRTVGGGFGLAVGFARWAIRALTGIETRAPISGQRALRAEVLGAALPFAPGFGIEIGMTVDCVRAGWQLEELDLDLEHRATGRTVAGFLHRGRQLADFGRVYLSRRPARFERGNKVGSARR